MGLPLLSLFKFHPEKKRLARDKKQGDTYSFQNASVLRINVEILCPYKIRRSFLNFMLLASTITYDSLVERHSQEKKLFFSDSLYIL